VPYRFTGKEFECIVNNVNGKYWSSFKIASSVCFVRTPDVVEENKIDAAGR
jgi:hypothetical protein